MALVVEDGTGVATAESYVTVAEFKAYWALRVTDPTYVAADLATIIAGADGPMEEALRVSTQEGEAEYFDEWLGDKGTDAQALAWPRVNAYSKDGGYLVSSTEVPSKLQDYYNERAARYIENIATGMVPDQAAPAGGIEREKIKVDVIEIDTGFSGSASQSKQYPKLENLLVSLLRATGGRVIRA